MHEIDVVGDGNCLFRAISLILEGTEKKYKKYRQIACKCINENREQLGPYITKEAIEKKLQNLKNKPQLYNKELSLVDQYLEILKEDKVFGGQIEIQALSLALNIKINIIGLGRQPIGIYFKQNENQDQPVKEINIKFQKEGHYKSIIKKEIHIKKKIKKQKRHN